MDFLAIAKFVVDYGPGAINLLRSVITATAYLKSMGDEDPVGTVQSKVRGLHAMSADEEQKWFDRASQSNGF